jgi:hypothetical protein
MTTNEFGPNTPKVELFIERLRVLSDEEIKTAAWAARDTARDARDTARDAVWAAEAAAWDTARAAAWDTARDTARDAVWATARAAAWATVWATARATARAAAWAAEAIVVMDLITEDQFTILTEPFAEVLVELGIVWEEE